MVKVTVDYHADEWRREIPITIRADILSRGNDSDGRGDDQEGANSQLGSRNEFKKPFPAAVSAPSPYAIAIW